jgi:hypothetical protein
MAILGKKLVLDMARMAALSYDSSDKLDTAYLYERPYMKGCHQMALLSIKEKPCFVSSEEDCQVVVAKYLCPDDKEKLVVAFRGTESGEDILTDLNISQEKLPLENMNEEDWPLVHSGFAGQFFSVNTKLDDAIADADSVLFCGHSLGGALATVGSVYYGFKHPGKPVDCVTFGSPRVGDVRFVDYFDKRVGCSLRYVNDNDPIPCVPTRWRFKHVGGLQWLNQDVVQSEIPVWRFYRFLKNTLLSVVGYGYNACDDHKCDNYITDIESIVVNDDDDVSV